MFSPVLRYALPERADSDDFTCLSSECGRAPLLRFRPRFLLRLILHRRILLVLMAHRRGGAAPMSDVGARCPINALQIRARLRSPHALQKIYNFRAYARNSRAERSEAN